MRVSVHKKGDGFGVGVGVGDGELIVSTLQNAIEMKLPLACKQVDPGQQVNCFPSLLSSAPQRSPATTHVGGGVAVDWLYGAFGLFKGILL